LFFKHGNTEHDKLKTQKLSSFIFFQQKNTLNQTLNINSKSFAVKVKPEEMKAAEFRNVLIYVLFNRFKALFN